VSVKVHRRRWRWFRNRKQKKSFRSISFALRRVLTEVEEEGLEEVVQQPQWVSSYRTQYETQTAPRWWNRRAQTRAFIERLPHRDGEASSRWFSSRREASITFGHLLVYNASARTFLSLHGLRKALSISRPTYFNKNQKWPLKTDFYPLQGCLCNKPFHSTFPSTKRLLSDILQQLFGDTKPCSPVTASMMSATRGAELVGETSDREKKPK